MATTRGSSGARLSAVLGIVIVVLGLGFVIRRLVSDWDEVQPLLSDASLGWTLVALLLAMAAMAAIGLRWGACLWLLSSRPRRIESLRWFSLGQLGKYAPGGVWHIVGQGELAKRDGVAGPVAYASVLLATLGLYGAAALLAAAFVPFLDGIEPWMGITVALAVAFAVFAVFDPHVVRRIPRLSASGVEVPSRAATYGFVFSNVVPWVLVGLATAAVGLAVDPSSDWLLIALAGVVSWLVGFLALPAPGGLGVREAAFVLFTESTLGDSTAAAVALIARVVFVAADALLPIATHALSRAQGWRTRPRTIVQGNGRADESTTKTDPKN